MREESHLDDMRTAIRGDFERLERRLGAQELMHVREREREPEPDPPQVLAAEAAEAAPVVHMESAEVEEPVEQREPAPRSWLARLLAAIPLRQV